MEALLSFFAQYPPFDELPIPTLQKIAAAAEERQLKAQTLLFEEGPQLQSDFFVVKTGIIRLFLQKDNSLVDRCAAGEVVGLRAHLGGQRYISSAIAEEEASVYAIPVPLFLEVLKNNASVALYFASGFAAGLAAYAGDHSDKARQYLSARGSQLARIQTELVKIKPSQRVITGEAHWSLQQAAQLMRKEGIGSLVIANTEKQPVGILTDSDFRNKVIALEAEQRPQLVKQIMSSPVHCIALGTSLAEALLKMLKKRVSHLCVTEDGSTQSPLLGLVSQRDLLVQQGNHPAALLKALQSARSVERLAELRDQAEDLLHNYLEQEVSIPFVSGIITEINDALFQKAEAFSLAALEAEELALPKGRYCWMSLGSEGRKEQFLRTDQDNAFVYELDAEQDPETARDFYLQLTARMRDILIECGFVRCPADIMASNPKWCQPLSVWKNYFQTWIDRPDGQALLQAAIFFDFRPVVGDASLAHELRSYLSEAVANNSKFLSFMALGATQSSPPLSFFRNFVLEKSGEHKDRFDLKARAMLPLVDSARVLAYQLDLDEAYSTVERFEQAAAKQPNIEGLCRAAAMGYEVLLRIRALHGFRNKDSGRYIDPDELNKLERQIVRSIFKTISKLQQSFETRFGLAYFRR